MLVVHPPMAMRNREKSTIKNHHTTWGNTNVSHENHFPSGNLRICIYIYTYISNNINVHVWDIPSFLWMVFAVVN